MKRAPQGSPRSGRHNIGDHRLSRKYGRVYAALWTCTEGAVFAAVFIRITTRNILQLHTGYAHTFHLNMSSGQGRHPLMILQRSPGTGRTPVFGALPPLRFTDQRQTGRLWKEGMHDGATTTFLMEGKHNLSLVGCCSLPA